MSILCKLLTLIVMSLSGAIVASAEPVTMPTPLETVVTRSDFVVIGKVIQLENNFAGPSGRSKPGSQFDHNGAVYLNAPGRYVFKVLYGIKGAPPASMAVTLPAIDALVYNGATPVLAVGSNVLLFAKRSQGSAGVDLMPTDSTLPLAVLDSHDRPYDLSYLQKEGKSQSVLQQVCNVLLHSVHDRMLLQANTCLLKDVVNPLIPQKLMPYIDDPNEKVQESVLACLASNQVVETIPRIARLHAKLLAERVGGGCVDKLEAFRVKEAVPYLNPLLFSPHYSVRFCTSIALRRVADATSIPYLVAGLADPDKTNKYECYATLTRLIPHLGDLKTIDDFDKNPNGICMPYRKWWQEELQGNHLQQH